MVDFKQITPRLRDRFHLHSNGNQDASTQGSGVNDQSSSRSTDPPSVELSTRSRPSRSSGSTTTAYDHRINSISKGKGSIGSLEIPSFLTPGGATPLTSPMADERSAFFSKGTPIDRLDTFGYIETVPRSDGNHEKPPAYSKYIAPAEPRSKHQKIRKEKGWYGHWSTRKIILAAIAGIVSICIVLGVTLGVVLSRKANHVDVTPTWRPAIETTWQIQLNGTVSNPSLKAAVYDIDLFSTTEDEISNMHTLGRRVICYFSIGTWESSRSDANTFLDSTLGNYLDGSTTERYIDYRSQSVQKVMVDRIKMAQKKGCDGLDVGGLDSYRATTSFPLTNVTAIKYLKYLSTQAHSLNLAIGLRNCPEIATDTIFLVDFEITESCVAYVECDIYQPFISAGMAVLHIEYYAEGNSTANVLSWACNGNGTQGFSTILKKADLGVWSIDCPLGLPGYDFY